MRASVPYEDILDDWLTDDELASVYLCDALAENEPAQFNLVLDDLARARAGGIAALSKKTGMKRRELYGAFSEKGGKRQESLGKIFRALGLRPVDEAAESLPMAKAGG